MIIEFGRWRLVPVDKLNWELCHWHAATRGKNEGVEQWNRLGRFYSWNTFGNALMFAADCELKERHGAEVAEIRDALAELRQTLHAFEVSFVQTCSIDSGPLGYGRD
jgi:hypothetical protein